MVSEDSSILSPKVSYNPESWLSVEITEMPIKSDNTCLDRLGVSIRVDGPSEDNPLQIAKDLVEEILETALAATGNQQVITRDMRLSVQDRIARRLHRNTSIVEEEGDFHPTECKNMFVNGLRRKSISVSEINMCTVDENENNISKTKMLTVPEAWPAPNKEVKKKKRLSFNSLFHKKDKSKSKDNHRKPDEDSETYDNFAQLPTFKSNNLSKSKKYASAVELSSNAVSHQSLLQRTPSFIKRLAHITEDSSNFLKRSLSFRESSKKKEKSSAKEQRERISETKNQEWRQSLQSLVESDVSVSYKDLSFVNYDALNQFNYEDQVHLQPGSVTSVRNGYIGRTQSMSEKRSEFRPPYQRLSSANETYRSSLCLTEYPGALSLPALHHIEQENVDTPVEENPHRLYQRRRRPPSASSEDSGVGSFRSAGTGKLKRHNATRQKSRYTFLENRQSVPRHTDDTVRSRSLTHLDALESRRSGGDVGGPGGVAALGESALKDARSEPDCARPLPSPEAPPATANHRAASVGAGRPAGAPKRHVLSRSQKSSSECFSVNFEVGDESTWDNELFFPAQRGVTLHDSLAKQCELRNIDLSGCDARLLDKEYNVESFIVFSQDTASLVGRHVRITAKDTSNKKLSGSFSNHSRKPSGSYKPRAGSFFSSSTEEGAANVGSSTLSLANEADQSKRQIKQRLTAFFGNSKDTKYEALIEQLDKFSRQGIPQNVNINYPQGQCESIDAFYKLEDDWRDIMGTADLPEKVQQQQTALWELIKTEVAYIKTLKVVTDLFLACLKDLQSRNLLKEIDTEKLFSNITEILGSNVIFWRNTLFPLVRDMRRYRHPPCIENMLEGFSKVHDTFQPYFKYCAEQSRCQHYCRENLDSEVFTAYLTWCESQKDCNRLRLMDILVQPMQRLTKYGLLLKAILKNTDEDVERESLQTMIKMVDDFVNSVNSSLKHRQDKERLKGIIARIESYDIVESKDDDLEKILKKDKSLTQLDLTRPMLGCLPERKRHLLLEGDLKLKDSNASKMEVHCFLLTDMLLICKPTAKRSSGVGTGATMRVVRQPYLVDRLVVAELTRETPSLAIVYKNEFDMAVAAFLLQSSDAKKIKGWKEGIAKAQALYAQARQPAYQEDSLDEYCAWSESGHGAPEADLHGLQPAVPRSPLATSSRASRVSSLAHSHSGSVEMNDQSSVGSRAVSGADTDNRTGSVSSDEGAQPLPADRSARPRPPPLRTPNTLSVQPHSGVGGGGLGQSLPNLSLGSPRVDAGGGGGGGPAFQHTLSVPGGRSGTPASSQHLLSPTHRGVSYPPPSPTRGNLRRSLAVQGATAAGSKHPPLVKTRQAHAATAPSSASGSLSASISLGQAPPSFDFDVPVIAGVHQPEDCFDSSFNRGQHRQAMKRAHRYHTAGLVDDIKKSDTRDSSIHKRLSWNCSGHSEQLSGENVPDNQT